MAETSNSPYSGYSLMGHSISLFPTSSLHYSSTLLMHSIGCLPRHYTDNKHYHPLHQIILMCSQHTDNQFYASLPYALWAYHNVTFKEIINFTMLLGLVRFGSIVNRLRAPVLHDNSLEVWCCSGLC